VSVLSLALVTGCGGGSDDADTAEDPGTSSSPTTAAKTLSTAELEKLIIAKADVDGYDVDSADSTDEFAASKDQVTVEDAACEPIAYVLTGFAPGDESAYVKRMASPAAEEITAAETEDPAGALEDALGATITFVSLSSHEGDGAAKTMTAVTDAVKGCAGGFTVSAKGQDTQKFTKVTEEKSTAATGESVAFAVNGAVDGGGEATVHAQVVRHGSTVATYYSLSLAALGGKETKFSVPAEIVTAQAAKLK
jgi:hypothetical protein